MKRKDFLRKTILLAFAPVIGSANAILYAKPNDYGDIPSQREMALWQQWWFYSIHREYS